MAESSWSLGRALRGMFVKPTIDETTWEDLETALRGLAGFMHAVVRDPGLLSG